MKHEWMLRALGSYTAAQGPFWGCCPNSGTQGKVLPVVNDLYFKAHTHTFQPQVKDQK